jgi:hypothetical protein
MMSDGCKQENRLYVTSDLRQYGVMADRYRAPGGWTVEVIHLSGTPDRRDGAWIRVRQHGFHVESSGIAVDRRGPDVTDGVLPYGA